MKKAFTIRYVYRFTLPATRCTVWLGGGGTGVRRILIPSTATSDEGANENADDIAVLGRQSISVAVVKRLK